VVLAESVIYDHYRTEIELKNAKHNFEKKLAENIKRIKNHSMHTIEVNQKLKCRLVIYLLVMVSW